MIEAAPFMIYPLFHRGEDLRSAHVLLHAHKPKWILVNASAIEAAELLTNKVPIDTVALLTSSKYSIPLDKAKYDALYVRKILLRENFLDDGGLPARSINLESLFIHLTNRCNLRCPHCYASSSVGRKDLPTPLVFRLIDELAQQSAKKVILSGGEPLLHPDFRKILEYASFRGLSLTVLTNGTLISREWAAVLAGYDTTIQISIDGSNADIHDPIRGRGSFDSSLCAIRWLQDAGMSQRINISTTITQQNVDDLPGIIRLAERIAVRKVRFLPVYRVGKAKDQWDCVGRDLNPQRYEQFYQNVASLKREKDCRVEVSCGLSGFMLRMPTESSADDIWCPVGRRLVVDVAGDLFPCALMMRSQFKLGNIYENTLAEALHSKEMAAVCKSLVARRVKIEKCSDCCWRNLCQAGCMGQALDHTGSIWETDHFCDYRKRAYQEAFDKILEHFSRAHAD